MAYMNGLLIVCLVFVVGHQFSSNVSVNSESLVKLTKEQCVKWVKKIDTISGYLDFANKMIPDSELSASVNEQESLLLLNRCLHSVYGHEDINELRRVIEQASTVHSVCEPEYLNKLLNLDTQLRVTNVSRGKYLKRKQKNRLSRFFRLFVGQVVLTCKRSLTQKLRVAEEQNKDLVIAIEKINELSAKNTGATAPTDARTNTKGLPKITRKLFDLAIKHTPGLFSKVENIVLFDSLKPAPDAIYSIGVTINSEQMLNEFIKTKQACRLIDEYAQSSIYTISRLAWRGYMARDGHQLDESLINDERVQKWIKAVQYCQGVLIVKVNLDLEQESLLKLDNKRDTLLNDEQILTVDVTKDDLHHTQMEQPKQLQLSHRFEQQTDKFTSFDNDLVCYTYSNGLTGWLMRRLGKAERSMANHIKLSVLDESFKQSLLAQQPGDDVEEEVQFTGGTGGAVSGNAFGHVTNHVVIAHKHGFHHAAHHLGGSPGAEVGIAFAIVAGVFLLALLITFMLSKICMLNKQY